MPYNLRGNIFVTGSNRGIGLELVKQLAERTPEDTRIYAGCRTPDGSNAQALRDLATQHAGKICIVELEMNDEESIESAVQTVSEKIGDGGLNLLINNAAILKTTLAAPLSEAKRQDLMDVFPTGNITRLKGSQDGALRNSTASQFFNPRFMVVFLKLLLPLLQRAAASSDEGEEMSCRRAAVINVSTIGASIGKLSENFHMAKMFAYRSSKAALNMLSCCFAMELKSEKILVMALYPGWVRTNMGGDMAPLTTRDSAKGMLKVMSSLSSKDTGSFLDWKGEALPW